MASFRCWLTGNDALIAGNAVWLAFSVGGPEMML